MTEKPTANDVKAHLDDARHDAGLVMGCIWGAVQGTAPRDRWDMAAEHLREAAQAIARAQAALDGMEKLEPYCTVCGEPVLNLMAGWSHIRTTEHVEPRQAGHEPELDWRAVGTPGRRTPLCTACGEAAATDEDGLCWRCGEDGDSD